MLSSLYISNYAIIDETDIRFTNGFNVITGETGAGKSILIGALSLVLGARADNSVLRDRDKNCVVEACFSSKNKQLKRLLKQLDVEGDEEVIVRRVLTPSGKSRAFMNDVPVKLTQLKMVGGLLVSLHAQHDTLQLAQPKFQIALLDELGEYQSTLNAYKELHQRWISLQRQLDSLLLEVTGNGVDADYVNFQLKELQDANLDEFDQAKLESQQKRIENLGEINQLLSGIKDALSSGEFAANSALSSAAQLLRQLTQLDNRFGSIQNRIESISIELEDLIQEVEKIDASEEVDESEVQHIQAQLNQLYRLYQKHGAHEVEELLQLRTNFEARLDQVKDHEENKKRLEQELASCRKQVEESGQMLMAERLKTAQKVGKRIQTMLPEVGLINGVFEIEVQEDPSGAIMAHGIDQVVFRFSANKGAPLSDMRKVASGGELSRLMLCIKAVAADRMDLPTLIFDEVDAGISGEIAIKVGVLIAELAQKHQVISITHLPQIAGKASHHLFVHKSDVGNESTTLVNSLDDDQRITEIAKMLSGELTDASIANAKELIDK